MLGVSLYWRTAVEAECWRESVCVCVCVPVWKVEELERKVIDSQLIAATDIVLKDTLKCTLGPMVWKSEGVGEGGVGVRRPLFHRCTPFSFAETMEPFFFFSPFIQN